MSNPNVFVVTIVQRMPKAEYLEALRKKKHWEELQKERAAQAALAKLQAEQDAESKFDSALPDPETDHADPSENKSVKSEDDNDAASEAPASTRYTEETIEDSFTVCTDHTDENDGRQDDKETQCCNVVNLVIRFLTLTIHFLWGETEKPHVVTEDVEVDGLNNAQEMVENGIKTETSSKLPVAEYVNNWLDDHPTEFHTNPVNNHDSDTENDADTTHGTVSTVDNTEDYLTF